GRQYRVVGGARQPLCGCLHPCRRDPVGGIRCGGENPAPASGKSWRALLRMVLQRGIYAVSRGSVRSLIPLRISRTRRADSVPIFSLNWDLSTVKIWDTLTTLCLGRLASPGSSRTFPGAVARLRLEVSAQTTTVLIRLRLKTLFWMTTCGWR